MNIKLKIFSAILLTWLAVTATAQQKKVTLNVKDAPIAQVLTSISRQTGIDFVYSNSQLRGFGPVSISVKDEEVVDVLGHIFKGKNYIYKFEKNSIVIMPRPANQQTSWLDGTVTDANGEPLPAVTVGFGEGRISTVTDSDGAFRLDVRNREGQTMLFKCMGMKDKKVAYSGQRKLKVTMYESARDIDEVVVTGYGTYNRSLYVGAVNQVKAEDVKIEAEATIDQMLQGVVPGMAVMNTTGKVGGTPKVRIRGTSTIMGNQEPLWVVDDVIQTDPTPIPNDASPLSGNMDEMLETAGNAISWLNPNDIETITVLKDASATAIYGSQASNGVIVITTKKAAANQRLSINYSGSLSLTERPSYGLYDMMNSQEYMRFQQEMYEDRNSYTSNILNIGYAGILKQLLQKKITQDEFNARFRQMEQQNTDWFKELFHTAVSTNHNFSVSGGTERVQSRFSLGFSKNNGEAKGNDMQNITVSTNTTYKASTKVSIDLSMNGSFRKTNNFYGVSPYSYAMGTSRVIPMYNEDGSLYYYPVYGTTSIAVADKNFYNYNIKNELDNSGTDNWGTTFQTALSLRWDVLKHLQFKGSASINLSTSKIKTWQTEYSNTITQLRGYEVGEVDPNSDAENSSVLPYGGMLNTQNENNANYSLRGSLVYTNKFAGKHNITANLGMQITSNKADGETMLRYGYLSYRGETFAAVPALNDLQHAAGYVSSLDLSEKMRAGTKITNTITNKLSEYATLVYSYDNRYVVNLNGRLDASNRFGQDENKRFNPSVSCGLKWRLGEEPFMKWAHDWFDLFDVSFSYGWSGNAVTAVSPYLIARDGGVHTYFKQFYLTIVSLPYPGLGWERTRDWNAGLNFSFLNGRISADLNYYQRKSKVLSSHDVGVEYGVSTAYIEGTEMGNKGYEVLLSTTPVRFNGWTWSVSFNTGRNFNSIHNNKLINSPEDYLQGYAIVEGEQYGTLYAYEFAGLSPENGYPTFNRLDPVEKPDDFKDYLVKVGCTEPDFTGGFSTAIGWHRWHLRAQFSMQFGAQAWLPQYTATSGATRPESNVQKYLFNRWRKPGDEEHTTVPAIPDGNSNHLRVTFYYGSSTYITDLYTMYNYSTERIADTDFIRCRSLSLMYNVPKEFSQHFGVRNAYASVSLTNPFFIGFDSKWEGRDPETSSWPARKSVSFNLNLTF